MNHPGPHALPSFPGPALTGASLERDTELRRRPGDLARLLADPQSRAVFADGEAVFVHDDGLELARLPVSQSPAFAPLLLGLEYGRAVFGVDAAGLSEADRSELLSSGRLTPLREAALRLRPEEGGLAAYLIALASWHRHHRHCANCGTMTEVTEAGLSRRCPRCGRSHFPRTDPVVIMLVEHEGRLLLGRRPIWPAGRYSLLAGFVSPGETPEEAVIREVAEESGIEAFDARYVASQPWPFPASLMLGYFARADGGSPHCADGELEDVRWFSREEIQAAADEGHDWSSEKDRDLLLPGGVSIARWLIDWWLSGAQDHG